MEPPFKKAKLGVSPDIKVLIRLGDAFTRTDGNTICPVIKAENSIRVLCKLRNKLFKDILREASEGIGLRRITLHMRSQRCHSVTNSNIFIECEVSQNVTDDKLKRFTELLTDVVRKKSEVKHILIDKVEDYEIIPQPIISETDFELYKLELCYKVLCDIPEDREQDALNITKEDISNTIEDLKDHYTKIAVLSQNGKGKSFFLNLLLLMTSDNEEEYKENNKNLKQPQDICGNPKMKEIMEAKEDFLNLPDVVREFIRSHPNDTDDVKTVLKTVYQELRLVNTEDVENSNTSFSSIPRYFTQGSRIKIEPYLLAQKSLHKSYESTTKCIIHLRYGTVYQLKVEYFEAEELQTQLFELVSLIRKDAVTRGINKAVKDKSCECLKTRFALLTNYGVSNINENFLHNFKKYEDIALSEDVKRFAGKTELYVGSGKNSVSDRLALKANLKRLTSPQDADNCENLNWKHRVAAVKEIVVYIPSKILYGGKEILEMPGTDDSDPLAMDFIQKALDSVDSIFVMSEFAFKIAEREVKEILLNSEFIKAWKKSPEFYSLMFLAYPEKDANFQFGENNIDKIKNLLKHEESKRSLETEELCKLLDLDTLSTAMDKSIFTSYVLPVLHTSILMQEGPPHRVISKYMDFVDITGINSFLIHLDKFVAFKQSESIVKVKEYLNKLNLKVATGPRSEEAMSVLTLLKNKELKSTLDGAFCSEYDSLLVTLCKDLKALYSKALYGKVENILASSVQNAKQLWEENEDHITARGIFNPYYCGNNPIYQVRMSNILFHNSENHKSEIFGFLQVEIRRLLSKFRKHVFELFTEQMNDLYSSNGLGNVDWSGFVKQIIKDPLTEALNWYIGKHRMPINKRTVSKYFEESKKLSLKKNLLIPAYNTEDLDEAKSKAKQNIQRAVMNVKEDFINSMLLLHEIRWKSFMSHLKTKNGVPKLWQILLGRLKQIAHKKQAPAESEILCELLKLISTNVN
ncbi:uncharacterized protein LOC134614241 isoform X1 [Pelobates fuscus]|uniref:uncharacterized protein LOC134614241 isoform X1 n=1 Tax=Pelobates fuscus TaxID=191477 RepID=UPI002FE4F7A4